MFRPLIVASVLFAIGASSVALAQPKLTREQQVLKDKKDFA